MATEATPGIYRIDVPTLDSQALFTEALTTIPHPPCYGELVFYAKGRERCLGNYTMHLMYCESGVSNLWFTNPAVDKAEALEHQNKNGEVAAILEEGRADEIKLNLGLAARTNPFIYEAFKTELLPQLQDAGYLIHSADLRLPSENLEKPFSNYAGNGLRLMTDEESASACLTLSHRSNMEVEQKSALEIWFANLQKAYPPLNLSSNT